jgi:hypothetical protein
VHDERAEFWEALLDNTSYSSELPSASDLLDGVDGPPSGEAGVDNLPPRPLTFIDLTLRTKS